MRAFLLRLALLCGVWLLALGQVSLGDLAVGVVVSSGFLLLLRPRMTDMRVPTLPFGRRTLAFIPFAYAILRDVTRETWTVALWVLGRRHMQPGYIEIPIGRRTPNGVAVTGWLVTLVPGSVLVRVDWERGMMLFHILDAADPDATRVAIDRFYERYQRSIFP